MDAYKPLIALSGLVLAALAACSTKSRPIFRPLLTRYRATISDDLETHEIDFRARSPLEAYAYAESQVFSPSEVVKKIVDLTNGSEVYRYGIGHMLPEKR